MFYTPWLVSERVPDYSSLERLVKSPRFSGLKGQALAVALWGLMVDRELGIFHYCPPQEALWKRDSQDPMLIFNSFGFTICHVHAHVLVMLFRSAGFDARIANIAGHEGAEAFYDGQWHYFDADIQMFHRKHPPEQHVIASREELYRDPSLVDQQQNPSNPYMIPDRPPAAMRKLYEAVPVYVDLLEERIHSMDFRLRPGETLTRYFHHRGRWHVFACYPEHFRKWPLETGPEGPTERFWPRRQWGNGFFHYAPRLGSPSREGAAGADEVTGGSFTAEGLTAQADECHALYSFESPYIYGGVPDPWRRAPSKEGALLQAAFFVTPGGSASVECSVYRAGEPERWQELWNSKGASGALNAELDWTEHVDGAFQAKLKFVLRGKGTLLQSFETKLWFMVSPHSLPGPVRAGENPMTVHCGDQFGVNTRTVLKEALLSTPGALDPFAIRENLDYDCSTFSILSARKAGQPWRLIIPVTAPRGEIVWLSAYALMEARRPGETVAAPATLEVASSSEGPWTPVASRELIEHPQGWHFAIFGETAPLSPPAKTVYARFSSQKGMKGYRIAAHYLDASADPNCELELEHTWYEDRPDVGRRECVHVERTQHAKHAYTITCAHTPHNERLTLRARSKE